MVDLCGRHNLVGINRAYCTRVLRLSMGMLSRTHTAGYRQPVVVSGLFALRGPQPSCIRHACWLLVGLRIGSGMVLGRMWYGFGVIDACLEQGSMAIGWAVVMCAVQAFICAHKVRTFYFGSSVRIFLDYWCLFFTESCFYGNRL